MIDLKVEVDSAFCSQWMVADYEYEVVVTVSIFVHVWRLDESF